MIVNGQTLLQKKPILDMKDTKIRENGVSYGLSEAGYDIRIKQPVMFNYHKHYNADLIRSVKASHYDDYSDYDDHLVCKRFTIASAIEEFNMPNDLVGIVHDKSTWARKGLSVFITVIEPGWKGFLTLELAYWGKDVLEIPAGAGIAQVVFHSTTDQMDYGDGKYQNQGDEPVDARFSDG